MNNHGFIKVACGVPKVKVANPSYNTNEIYKLVKEAKKEGAKILITPELSISSYTCADLFFQDTLLEKCEEELEKLIEKTAEDDIFIVVGMPVRYKNSLYNCAVAFLNGEIIGVIPKEFIPTHSEFYEKRWFVSGSNVSDEIYLAGQEVSFGQMLFKLSNDLTVGIEVCEDLWVPIAPSAKLALSGANLILNISASNEVVSKDEYRTNLISSQSAKCLCAYAYVSAGVHESTTDLLFGGSSLIAENGIILNKGKRFERENQLTCAYIDLQKLNFQRRQNISFSDSREQYEEFYEEIECEFEDDIDITNFNRFIDPHPFTPNDETKRIERCNEIFNIQSSALAKRLEHTGLKKLVVGISGGLDSTLALLVANKTMKLLNLPSENIIGITMPGFGTTDRTYTNAIDLMKSLKVTIKEISIKEAATLHMKDIEHDIDVHDVTYENTQARERTQVLMDMANKHGAILVGTGDLSEMALGWCTYNGDHMSMYGVNASVPKTLVSHLVRTVAMMSDDKTKEILLDILDTPVSPELLPPTKDGKIAQKTEDNIGPYELHDFFLYYFIRFGAKKDKLHFLAKQAFKDKYSDETIEKWLNNFMRRFFISQFKRSCTPDAPKVGSVSLSPRGDFRMPSDADFSAWLED
ncbi:NAD(+) synthase [Anaerofustis stercorihominis]|uniref:NAD(+) synthase n=1 Tax=Anaerofustis stercorihominis TaxID=214853 RepID=UPI00214BFD1C|nr:NAD(+) synthase [Anaerofustis stercorihominis]MCR2032223.1 NAD(+) synthase [Anaerofustis stercorihominis]